MVANLNMYIHTINTGRAKIFLSLDKRTIYIYFFFFVSLFGKIKKFGGVKVGVPLQP